MDTEATARIQQPHRSCQIGIAEAGTHNSLGPRQVACVDVDRLGARTLEIARKLAALSPTALAFTKRSLNHWLRTAWPIFEHSLALEFVGFGLADAREGFATLSEKRPTKSAHE